MKLEVPAKLVPGTDPHEMIVAYGPGEFSLPPLGYLDRVVVRDAKGRARIDEQHGLVLLQVANTVTPRYTIAEGEHLIMVYREIDRIPGKRKAS